MVVIWRPTQQKKGQLFPSSEIYGDPFKSDDYCSFKYVKYNVGKRSFIVYIEIQICVYKMDFYLNAHTHRILHLKHPLVGFVRN